MRERLPQTITLLAFALFWLAVAHQEPASKRVLDRPADVVVSAPVQVLLFAGDRFLSADIEAIRATAAATTPGAYDYRLRAHHAVSRLNPCHEDNYWIGNASLSWGGAPKEGFELLRNAIRCRNWDEWPAFFYAFNQHFFLDNQAEARRVLEIAADRSSKNAAAFLTFSTMLAADRLKSAEMARKMIKHERDTAKDPKLREMLDKRVGRLDGLITLREAQSAYERRFGKSMTRPQQLLESGLLENFPADPLGVGYEFRDQTFHLKQMQIR